MIALITDFGYSEYIGVMKAVIYNAHPNARIVDLCHTVSPQCIIEAAWILKNNHKYFPSNTVFCCVVDPGVGSERKAVAVQTDSCFFVAPDNGLLWPTLEEHKNVQIREVPVPDDASKTFHGRDVFARAAAQIDAGGFDKIGPAIKNIKRFRFHLDNKEGAIVRVDHFGNIVTNIPKLEKERYSITLKDKVLQATFYPTYSQAPENQLFLIEGSNKTLEISVKNKNASQQLNVKPGQKIKIM